MLGLQPEGKVETAQAPAPSPRTARFPTRRDTRCPSGAHTGTSPSQRPHFSPGSRRLDVCPVSPRPTGAALPPGPGLLRLPPCPPTPSRPRGRALPRLSQSWDRAGAAFSHWPPQLSTPQSGLPRPPRRPGLCFRAGRHPTAWRCRSVFVRRPPEGAAVAPTLEPKERRALACCRALAVV